jgi:hypothetical protein
MKPRLKLLPATGDADRWIVNGAVVMISGFSISVLGRWRALAAELISRASNTITRDLLMLVLLFVCGWAAGFACAFRLFA